MSDKTGSKHIRSDFDAGYLTAGLFVTEAKEDIPDEGVLNVDGFVIYQGLWKKDWSLVKDTDTIMANINYYLDTSLPTCSTGERGLPTTWPSDPPDIPENPDTRTTLAWWSFFSGVNEVIDFTFNTSDNRTFNVEVYKNSGPVTLLLEKI